MKMQILGTHLHRVWFGRSWVRCKFTYSVFSKPPKVTHNCTIVWGPLFYIWVHFSLKQLNNKNSSNTVDWNFFFKCNIYLFPLSPFIVPPIPSSISTSFPIYWNSNMQLLPHPIAFSLIGAFPVINSIQVR